MAFVVIYDACVLHSAPLRDLLIRIAGTGVVRARWSERILDECFESILRRRPELATRLDRIRELMCDAVADCLVTGFEHLESGLDLPDADDCHVLAAAIRAGAQAIVTFNLADFPDHVLERYDTEAKHPHEFVLDSIDLAPARIVQCVRDQAAALRGPPMSVAEMLDTLRRCGLVQSVARIRDLLGPTSVGDV